MAGIRYLRIEPIRKHDVAAVIPNSQYIPRERRLFPAAAIRGVFSFSNTWTGNPFGDFLLGLPAAYTQIGLYVAYSRHQIYNFFVQDDYRILPNLTLNLGMRYEYGTPNYEKYNRMSNYNLDTAR
jgi:TonB dependent receptor